MIQKLFLQEVPEIYEGIVEIKGVAREPGGRAKIAVASRDSDVDPVGACVGMRGMRVQAVVQELRGEKIDIVHWIADQVEYACRALAPAKVTKIIMSEDEHSMEVIVPDEQLSLAIGRKGQNVRLASRLTGWRIDVRSEAEAEEENRRARISIGAIPGVNDIIAELLYQAGYKSAEELAEADLEAIKEVDGIAADKAEAIHQASKVHVEELKLLEEQRQLEEQKKAEEQLEEQRQLEEQKKAEEQLEEGSPEEQASPVAAADAGDTQVEVTEEAAEGEEKEGKEESKAE
jgi:N utilization substance protein A